MSFDVSHLLKSADDIALPVCDLQNIARFVTHCRLDRGARDALTFSACLEEVRLMNVDDRCGLAYQMICTASVPLEDFLFLFKFFQILILDDVDAYGRLRTFSLLYFTLVSISLPRFTAPHTCTTCRHRCTGIYTVPSQREHPSPCIANSMGSSMCGSQNGGTMKLI